MNGSMDTVRHRIPHRLLAIVLSLALLVGLLPTQTYALPPGVLITNPGASPITPLPETLAPGQVWTDKSVRYEGDGVFDIQLRAAAKDFKLEKPKPQDSLDVVFVLDVSGSMKDNNRLSNLKTAAKKAVTQLLAVEGNRVAVVSYSDWAQVQSNFTANSTAISAVIDTLTANGGTNIQNAYLVTETLFTGRSDTTRKPVVILMSDGQPTYYHKSLTSHTSGNREGEGYAEDTTGDYIWNTVLQANHLKASVEGVRIYTVGFAVGSNAFAISTLQPTDANTAAYRPQVFNAKKRTSLETAEYQHSSRRNNANAPWSAWTLISPVVKRNAVVNYSAWESVEKLPSSPTNTLESIVVPSFANPKSLSQDGNRRTAYFNGSRSGIEYKDITTGLLPFEHLYYEPESSLAEDGAQAIIDAFTRIVVDLTTVNPFKPNGIIGSDGKEGITGLKLVDVLGKHFEVLGSLPAGLTLNTVGANRQIEWSLEGASIPTHGADEATVDFNKVLSVSFKVKISEDAPLGTHNTNIRAHSEFSTHDKNPAYPKPTTNPGAWPVVTTELTNRGWLTLEAPDTPAKLIIEKQVQGPVVGSSTFYFQLYSQAEGGVPLGGTTPVQIGVTVQGASTGQGEYSFNIPNDAFDRQGQYTLYVEEVSATHENPRDQHDAWTMEAKRKAVVFTRAQGTVTASFVNQYNPKGTLTVKKLWSGDGPKSTVSFDLFKAEGDDWTLVSEGHVIPESGVLQLTNLDLGVKYTVRERTPEDYLALYTPHHVVFTTEALAAEITIENAYQRPTAKIKIEKTWNHGDQPQALWPAQVYFKVTYPSGVESLIRVSPDDAGKWETTLESYEFGRYEIEELPTLDYFAKHAVKSVDVAATPVASRLATVAFDNQYLAPTGTLTVEKKWDQDEGFEQYRPETIQLKVLLDGKPTDYFINLPEADDTPWKATLTELPFGTYSVEEVVVADYTPSYSEPVTLSAYNADGGAGLRQGYIAVTNTFDKPTGSIAVEKTWIEALGEAGDVNAVRPSQITVSLYKNGEVYQSIVLPKADGSWKHTFEGLPLDGSQYTVDEAATGDQQARLDHYQKTLLYGEGELKAIVLNREKRTGTVQLINRYGLGALAIAKAWVHGDNPKAERPDTAVIKLFSENMGTGKKALVDTFVVTEGQGPVVRYNLPLDANLRYYLEEEAVPFYEAAYGEPVVLTEDAPSGVLSVSNTYVQPTGTLTVQKVWRHGNNPEPATAVTVVLYKNGEAVAEAQVTSAHTFTGLELGAEYTVSENPVSGYISTLENFEVYVPTKVEGQVPSGIATFVNHYVEPVGSLRVTKEWVGKVGGPIDISVVRYLKESVDKEFVVTAVLSDENAWAARFDNLPLYGPGGVAYRYTVQESGDDLALYTPSEPEYLTLEANGTVTSALVNTYTPNQGELVIEKQWWGADESPMKTPPVDAITVRLIVDGEPEAVEMVLSAENNWRVVRSQLSVEKTYRVEEVDVPEGFRVILEGEDIRFDAKNLEALIRITNMETYPEPALSINKTVDSVQRQLVEGLATFNYTVVVKNTGNRTLTNVNIEDILSLPEGVTASYNFNIERRSEGEAQWRLKHLAPNQSYTVQYSITYNAPGDYLNTAKATALFGEEALVVQDQVTVKVLSEVVTITKPTTTVSTTATTTATKPVTTVPTTASTTTQPVTTAATTATPPTTVETTTVQPTTVQPTTIQPTTAQPTTIQPTTVQPVTTLSTANQPETIQTVTEPATQAPTQPQTSAVVIIEENTVPQGALTPTPVDKPGTNAGESSEESGGELVFNEVVVPQGALPNKVLPQTGEGPQGIYFGLGGLLTAIGVYLVRRRKEGQITTDGIDMD